MRTAVLVDLTFALKRYRTLIERPSGRDHTPEEIVTCFWETAKKHADSGEGKLYRILCYDCDPYSKGSTNPISRRYVNFSRTETAQRNRAIHKRLLEKRSVASGAAFWLAGAGHSSLINSKL